MAYTTLAEARAVGAHPTDDAAVLAAIADAQAVVDRFTGDVFEPRTMTVMAKVGGGGICPLPHTVQTVTAVEPVARPSVTYALAPGAWALHSSLITGDYDGLEFARGYAGLAVKVTGSFGYPVAPSQVRRAAALIAASIAPATSTTDAEGSPIGRPDVGAGADESPLVAAARLKEVGVRSTGVPEADKLLAPLLRRRIKVA